MPNGILLTPDGKTLYVNNTYDNESFWNVDTDKDNWVWAYDVNDDGTVANPRKFAQLVLTPEVAERKGRSSGADGMTIDENGGLYVATYMGVQVFNPKGEFLGIINTPDLPGQLLLRRRRPEDAVHRRLRQDLQDARPTSRAWITGRNKPGSKETTMADRYALQRRDFLKRMGTAVGAAALGGKALLTPLRADAAGRAGRTTPTGRSTSRSRSWARPRRRPGSRWSRVRAAMRSSPARSSSCGTRSWTRSGTSGS